MGKANKVKKDLMDAVDMVDILQTLKDIAENKFFTMQNQKDKFRRFGETFVEFFRMIRQTDVKHPLVANDHPVTGILVITIEGSFLGEFNNKIIRGAFQEKEKISQSKFLVVGRKGADKLAPFEKNLKVWTEIEAKGLYETAIEIKDYLVDEIMNGRLGKVVVAYAWPKSYEIQKAKTIKLLPCEDLISKQAQTVDIIEKLIEESDPKEVIGYLSNLWITTRLYAILVDTLIASAAAQANFLEESLDKMKKEHKKIKLNFRKAKKSDIDKGLRETFTARMMITK